MFNMAAPLIECTKEQQKPVIRFLWPEDVKTCKIYARITMQNSDNCGSQKKIYEWAERF